MDARGKALLGKAIAVVMAIAECEARALRAKVEGIGFSVPKSALYLAMGQDLEELERVLRIGARAGWLDYSAVSAWLLPKGREVARLVGERGGA